MKTKNRILIASSLMALCLYWSCDQIFEDDIENETVSLMAPSDGLKTEVLTHTFWWDEVEGAKKYNIQIASPSFTEINRLVVDSNLSEPRFSYTLSPGTYQWRVNAFNDAYETAYTTYELEVDSTLDLSGGSIRLLSPTDSFVTNQTSLSFKWEDLPNADFYELEFREAGAYTWEDQYYLSSEKTQNTSLTIDELEEGEYHWGIRGSNDLSSTMFTHRYVLVDTSDPDSPTLISPANNTELADSTITLKWGTISDGGASVRYKLYIYANSALTQLEESQNLSQNQYSWKTYVSGDYYWYVVAEDAAGNTSSDSEVWQFNVNLSASKK
jgi:hypothetical protein